MKRNYLLILLILIYFQGRSQYIPGNTYCSPSGYIEYATGNLPIIISVPHDGTDTLNSVPDRTCFAPVLVRDTYAKDLAFAFQKYCYEQLGCYPHVIICRLTRKKVDCNRNITEGACGNSKAEQVWKEYHGLIDSAAALVHKKYGKGFYMDIHAQGHTIQRVELGYLLNTAQLQLPDATLNTNEYIDSCSIKKLVRTNPNKYTLAQLLKGQYSFGALLRTKGFPAVPSDNDPYPKTGDPYFSGAYDTEAHSSLYGGSIDGVQIETNYKGVRDTPANRTKFGDSLFVAVMQYLKKHYFLNNELSRCSIPTQVNNLNYTADNSLFEIFPNPASEDVHIMLNTSSPDKALITIYNSLGQLVYQKPGIEKEIILAVKQFGEGLYLINVEINGNIQSKKLLMNTLR
jgi:N-formylglutamate amidohydrolase